MHVHHAVIHKIEKDAGQHNIVVTNANQLLAIDETVTRVTTELRDLYRHSNVYGVFQENPDEYRFQVILDNCEQGDYNQFLDFTVNAIEILQHRMALSAPSAGGYVFFAHYEESEEHFLFIVMLRDTVGAHVTSNLTLEDSLHLDLTDLFVAGRINITRWREVLDDDLDTQHKYVSFIRRKRELANYFIDFIGCTEIVRPKEATTKLIEVLDDYMQQNEFPAEKKESFRSRTREYLTSCVEHQNEASVEYLSRILDEDNPDSFNDHASQEQYNLSSLFRVDPGPLVRLLGVTFSSAELKLKMTTRFVRDHVSTDNRSVVITDAPKELLAEIQKLI